MRSVEVHRRVRVRHDDTSKDIPPHTLGYARLIRTRPPPLPVPGVPEGGRYTCRGSAKRVSASHCQRFEQRRKNAPAEPHRRPKIVVWDSGSVLDVGAIASQRRAGRIREGLMFARTSTCLQPITRCNECCGVMPCKLLIAKAPVFYHPDHSDVRLVTLHSTARARHTAQDRGPVRRKLAPSHPTESYRKRALRNPDLASV